MLQLQYNIISYCNLSTAI